MDKTEYKIRAEEIKSLIRAQRFAEAVRIADTIDWKRVKSVGMLCAISDLYKVNRRLEESRDILLLAYDRSPTRREIVYSLCELAIAMGEFVQAVEYYKEFVRLAPRNTARYILQYKLYEAQEVSLEERIAVLEEYKKHDYNEKWAYELAYLYHRVGLTTECIEECDELFLYMREGRYVIKALELKALHEPLSPEQKAVYAKYKAETSGSLYAPDMQDSVPGKDVVDARKSPTRELPEISDEQLSTSAGYNYSSDAAYYDNQNVAQQPYAQNNYAQDLQQQTYAEQAYGQTAYEAPVSENLSQDTMVYDRPQEELQYETPLEDSFSVPTVNVDTYNTVDLQKEIAANLKDMLTENPDAALFADAHGPQVVKEGDETENLDTGEMFDTTGEILKPSMSELFYEDRTAPVDNSVYQMPVNEAAVTEDLAQTPVEGQSFESTDQYGGEQYAELQNEQESEQAAGESRAFFEMPVTKLASQSKREAVADTDTKIWNAEEIEQARDMLPTSPQSASIAEELKDKEIAANLAASAMQDHAMYKGAVFTDEPLQDEVPGAVIKPNVRYQINNSFDKMLSQEYDGQISLAIDDSKQVEKQITGQISINEFMQDWENYKKQQQDQQYKKVKKLADSETGELFKEFDQNLVSPMLDGEISPEEALIKSNAEIQNEQITSADSAIEEPLVSEAGSIDDVNYEEDIDSKGEESVSSEELTDNETLLNTESSNAEQESNDFYAQEPENEELSSDEYASDEIDTTQQELSDNEAITEEDQSEIKTVDDLQNTQSMVLITGEDLETAKYLGVEEEPSKEPEENTRAAEVDLGETTEISSEEIEKAVRESVKEKKEDARYSETTQNAGAEDKEEFVEETTESAKEEAEVSEVNEHVDLEDDKDDKGIDERVRVMTPEEKGLFGPYIHHKKSRRQIVRAIDSLSMAAYTNNAIVTGEEGAGTVNLAKGLIKAVQATDDNFSGKVAMITAIKLNKSSVSSILDKIVNGALIIRRAADLKEDTVITLLKQLQSENKGYIVVIEDTKDDIDRLLDKYPDLKKCFNVRVDIEALDDDSLVAYAEQYALEKEHVIDNLGILALHQKISERQTLDHEVTVSEVKEMVDDAIYYADKYSVGHYFDVLFRKRFDKEDMIILREKDFLH
ncbi:tetratricopeptide repeat protein [Butyrivibrio sp. LC3010]|uniref:tetratricopeptide repeat protein n=1 Tax=Butyrivibrio sp. LC3010 TaxID=1280680 RepID=UPI0003F87628|nr:hypothetical protein [Butyrivibrio sp. LC3010]